MASFLKEKEEEKRKLPTITIAIVSHGMDLINEKLPEIDSNVRIYSMAGQALCFSIITANQLDFVEELYYSDERISGEDKRTSYEMLQAVAKHYKMPKHNKQYIETVTNEIKEYPKSSKHTLKTIANQKHSQIYTPFYDHLYEFTNNTGVFGNNNQISVIETKNHTSISNINYKILPNLANQQYAIQYPSLDSRKEIEELRFIDFFKKFNLPPTMPEDELDESEKIDLEHLTLFFDKSEIPKKTSEILLNSKLKQYSKNIYENRHLFFKDGFVSEFKLLKELENPDSILYTYIKYPEDKEIIQLTINEMKNLESDDATLKIQKINKRRTFYNESIIPQIKLSQIISFLKSEGFVIINIIDFSCRVVNGEVSKNQIRILDEQQQMIAHEIDEGLGKKRRQKTKRTQRRKRTQRTKRAVV